MSLETLIEILQIRRSKRGCWYMGDRVDLNDQQRVGDLLYNQMNRSARNAYRRGVPHTMWHHREVSKLLLE